MCPETEFILARRHAFSPLAWKIAPSPMQSVSTCRSVCRSTLLSRPMKHNLTHHDSGRPIRDTARGTYDHDVSDSCTNFARITSHHELSVHTPGAGSANTPRALPARLAELHASSQHSGPSATSHT